MVFGRPLQTVFCSHRCAQKSPKFANVSPTDPLLPLFNTFPMELLKHKRNLYTKERKNGRNRFGKRVEGDAAGTGAGDLSDFPVISARSDGCRTLSEAGARKPSDPMISQRPLSLFCSHP